MRTSRDKGYNQVREHDPLPLSQQGNQPGQPYSKDIDVNW